LGICVEPSKSRGDHILRRGTPELQGCLARRHPFAHESMRNLDGGGPSAPRRGPRGIRKEKQPALRPRRTQRLGIVRVSGHDTIHRCTPSVFSPSRPWLPPPLRLWLPRFLAPPLPSRRRHPRAHQKPLPRPRARFAGGSCRLESMSSISTGGPRRDGSSDDDAPSPPAVAQPPRRPGLRSRARSERRVYLPVRGSREPRPQGDPG
jgi:hypothetical protein